MARLSWHEFRRALRAANPSLVFFGNSKSLASMIYLNEPGNPDAVEGTSLVEVLAIASPTFFRFGCPAEDVLVPEKEQNPASKSEKSLWVRGYKNFFKQLLKKRDKNGQKVVKNVKNMRLQLPSDTFTASRHRKQKNDWLSSLADAPSDFEKKRQWLKSRSKPIPGNGMPLDWKRERIYSAPGQNLGLEYQRV